MTKANVMVDTELETLIKEQKQDIKRGRFQPHERHVAFSFDEMVGEDGSMMEFNGFTEYATYRTRFTTRSYGGCPIHGRSRLKYSSRGTIVCLECEREREALRRRLAGVPQRKACPHPPEARVPEGKDGKLRCKPCRNEQRQAYYRAFYETHGMSPNTYKKRQALKTGDSI